MKIRTEVNKEKVLYPVAKILVRILARFFDTVLILGLLIAIYFIITTNKNLSFATIAIIEFSVSFVLFFIYYIIISFFTKGWTLFRWIFKIKLIELIDRKKYFWHLIIHDLFIWIDYLVLMIIFSGVAFTIEPSNQKNFFNSLFLSIENPSYIVIIFKVIFSMFGLISISFLIYNCMNSGKRSIQDLISWTVMISMNKQTPEDKNKNFAPSEWSNKNTKKLHLPGTMSI